MNATSAAVPQIEVTDSVWFGGGRLDFKVTSAQSGGSLLLFEHVAARGKMTPLHIHAEHEETAYVLEGELLVLLDGVEISAGPGSAMCFPRGVPHAFVVVSETARSLWAVTPGGVMESFIRLAGDVALTRDLPPAEIDIPRLIAAGESTGAMKVLGPPPFGRG